MGKENDARLCNALIKTIRTITARVHDEQLPPDLKNELRPLFKDSRELAFFYYEHLRKDDSDLAVPMEWKIVKTIGEEIASCTETLIMEKMTTFKEYLDFCTEELPPLEKKEGEENNSNDPAETDEDDWDVSSLDKFEIDISDTPDTSQPTD